MVLMAPAASAYALGSEVHRWSALGNGKPTVAGQVRLREHSQATTERLPVWKSRAYCGSSVADETLLTGSGGGVRNAVVLLHPLDRVTAVQPRRIVLDNIRCAFAPHVQAAPVGSELLLKNGDPILHTVHARLGKETLFNVGLPRWRRLTKILDRPGVLRIDCDVLHTWMSAAIVVTTTPYFAVSDEGGGFSLAGTPPGNYRMEVWHERLGTKTKLIALTGEVPLTLDVVFALNPEGR
jgi:hypothetical protein